ncbi:alpha/beta fold hydrolase [Nocardia pseudovaccinii]|uniref:alpha/beta fold hydrolase n=1 Tax=Nocardia pseudovaccinii TaxID=189540 RepID=UPI0007A40589|nr:alpha/beta hydrolase [Nocardia pseudovaccinii]
MVRGTGAPTVVFESGMGFSRSIWGLVQPVVAERVRAVVYDRAGSGRSDDDPNPRTLTRMADDLAVVLAELGEGPFILVGHSWGGPIVRVAATADPTRIQGIVLVDQSDENCELYFLPSAEKRYAMTRVLLPKLARSGLYRLLGSRIGSKQPADIAADHRAEDFTPRAARTMLAEQDQFSAGLRNLRDQPHELGAVHVSVITGTKLPRTDKTTRIALTAAHRRTAAALRNGRLVEAERSGHLIMFTEPDLIVDEILRIADRA